MRRSTRIGWMLLCVALALAVLAVAASPVWAQDEGAAPAAAPAAAAARQETVFTHYFIDGGPIVWFVLLPLSIAVVALGVMNGLEIRRINLLPPDQLERVRSLLEARQYREAIEETGNGRSMFSYVVHQGLSAAGQGYAAMERAMEDAIDERAANYVRRIEPLNIIGNVGPLIGLFGTVVGMIATFTAIVAAGGVPSATELAKGISIALVCTTWGLVVAIPGLSVYGVFRNRIDMLASEVASRGQEILGMFRTGTATRAGSPTGPAPKPAAPANGPRPIVQPQANA